MDQASVRAPFITIEGNDSSINHTVIQNLISQMAHPAVSAQRFNDQTSLLGIVLSRAKRGSLRLQDIVHYNLRVANLWEHQSDLQYLLRHGASVILDKYVLTNRAYLLSKGNVSLENCYQFDAGLAKPDIQIFIKNKVQTFEEKRARFPLDTILSRTKVSEAYDKLTQINPDIYVIDNIHSNITQVSEKVIEIYNQKTKIHRPSELSYFNGTD
jgi:thymidylate kinase